MGREISCIFHCMASFVHRNPLVYICSVCSLRFKMAPSHKGEHCAGKVPAPSLGEARSFHVSDVSY